MAPKTKFEVGKTYVYYKRHNSVPTFEKIIRITPKGSLVSESGTRYNAAGENFSGIYSFIRLQEITQVDIDNHSKATAAHFISTNFKPQQFSLVALQQIAAIVETESARIKEEEFNKALARQEKLRQLTEEA